MERIRNLRHNFGLTQTELAEETGLSLRTIQRIESGETSLKGHSLKKVAEVFNLSPSDLLQDVRLSHDESEDSLRYAQFLNLSVLSFIGIPFGNLILPIILWSRYKMKSDFVDQLGRRIINFQIIWWLITAFLLTISPLMSRLFFGRAIILYMLFICYAFNVGVVFYNAKKLKLNQPILNSPFSLLW